MSQRRPDPGELDRYAYAYTTNGGDQSKAWREAFPNSKANDAGVHREASTFHKIPEVRRRIEEVRAEAHETAKEAFKMEVEDVLREWVMVAQADPAELAQRRRGACRYCHGFDNEYHWKDEKEFQASVDPNKDDFGGYGYRFTAKPAPDCPKCEGLGEAYNWTADTRDLSPNARKLFAGVKQTRDGTEIKMRDRDAALVNIAKYFGMFTENLNLSSPDGTMTPTVIERRVIDSKDDL